MYLDAFAKKLATAGSSGNVISYGKHYNAQDTICRICQKETEHNKMAAFIAAII
jgi:hypothetical protein